MVDYDGVDHVKTIVNALDWVTASITEPTYLEQDVYKNTEIPNVLLFKELSFTPIRTSTTSITYEHDIEIQFHFTTKALLWPTFEFVYKALENYKDGTKYTKRGTIGVNVRYSESRKIYDLQFVFCEVKSI